MSIAETEVGKETLERCPVCKEGLLATTSNDHHYACPACEQRYPDALLKAVRDPFDYALRLVTGEVVRFHQADIKRGWAWLQGSAYEGSDGGVQGLKHPCDRGVWVRIEHVVWVADAPEGS